MTEPVAASRRPLAPEHFWANEGLSSSVAFGIVFSTTFASETHKCPPFQDMD